MALLNRHFVYRAPRRLLTSVTIRNCSDFKRKAREHCEVEIPVPWGIIRGKWWGPTDKRPILGLHGWQDNCGTFDTLAPLLAPDIGFLAIDMPGHGLSSWYPPGFFYRLYDGPVLIKKIEEYLGWNRVSLVGHSLGSVQSFLYTSLYPDHVDFIVGVDLLKPIVDEKKNIARVYGQRIDKFIKYDNLASSDAEPPTYTREEAIEKWCKGTFQSVTKEYAHYLLERSVRESKFDSNKYYFSRDPRLKSGVVPSFLHEQLLDFAHNIKCPIMNIKAKDSPYFEDERYYFDVIDILRQVSKDCIRIEIEGTHHIHLLNPERIVDQINKFITKHNVGDTQQKPNIIDKILVHKY